MLTPEERERQAEIAAANPSGAKDTCSMDKYILDDVDGALSGPVRAQISTADLNSFIMFIIVNNESLRKIFSNQNSISRVCDNIIPLVTLRQLYSR